MERAKGIEPSREAWKASVLPLNYARILCHYVIHGACVVNWSLVTFDIK